MRMVVRRGGLRAAHRSESADRRNGVEEEDHYSTHRDREGARMDHRVDESRSLRHEDEWVVDGERRSRVGCERTWRWGRMAVQRVKRFRGHSGPGKLDCLAEGENRHCDSLVLSERSSGSLTTWLELNHCGCPLVEEVANRVGEAVEVSAGGIRGAEIL